MAIDPQESLGDLAATGSVERGVLLRHQLDFCCRGHRSLADACEAEGLDLQQILSELEAASSEPTDEVSWRERPIPELVQHILDRFHRPLRQQLGGVVAAAEKVERVHGDKPACPRGLARHLRSMQSELLLHLAKEEQVLFPALSSGRRGEMLNGPITMMTAEHDDHGESLKRMRELAHGFTPPDGACATWRSLYEELERLEADLMAHIHLENHVLFPRARQGA